MTISGGISILMIYIYKLTVVFTQARVNNDTCGCSLYVISMPGGYIHSGVPLGRKPVIGSLRIPDLLVVRPATG